MLTVDISFKKIPKDINFRVAVLKHCPTLFSLIGTLVKWDKRADDYKKENNDREKRWDVEPEWKSKMNFFDQLCAAEYGDIRTQTFLSKFDEVLKDFIRIVPEEIRPKLPNSIFGRLNNFKRLAYMSVFGELFAIHNVVTKRNFELLEMDSPRISNLISAEHLTEPLAGDYDFKLRNKDTGVVNLVEMGNILTIDINEIHTEEELTNVLRESIASKIDKETSGIEKGNLKHELFFVFVVFTPEIQKWIRFKSAFQRYTNQYGLEFSTEYKTLSLLTYIRIPWSTTGDKFKADTFKYEMDTIENFISKYENYSD